MGVGARAATAFSSDKPIIPLTSLSNGIGKPKRSKADFHRFNNDVLAINKGAVAIKYDKFESDYCREWYPKLIYLPFTPEDKNGLSLLE